MWRRWRRVRCSLPSPGNVDCLARTPRPCETRTRHQSAEWRIEDQARREDLTHTVHAQSRMISAPMAGRKFSSPQHEAVHRPPDRRLRVWTHPRYLVLASLLLFTPLALAWGQYLLAGLPQEAPLRVSEAVEVSYGFPPWVRLTHFANFLLLTLLMRSGLSILELPPQEQTGRVRDLS